MMKTRLYKPFLFALAFLLSLFIQCYSHAAEDRSFVVVIPSSNNKEWIKRNLDSVFSQSYTHFRVIHIDDGSTDGTGEYVREYIQNKGLQQRAALIHNQKTEGSLSCIYKAVQYCSPSEIVVLLKGSDWFAHRHVLAHLNSVYTDPDVWLTYGQYCSYPDYSIGSTFQIPLAVIEQNTFRDNLQTAVGYKTFYTWLFRQIKKDDLLDKGTFYPAGSNLALSLPLLEMAGRHSRFIPDVNYVFNSNRGEGEARDHSFYENLIRLKEPYLPFRDSPKPAPLKKIYITPGLWGELFSISNPIFNRDNCLDVLYRLRETARKAGYELLQAHDLESLQDFEYLVVFDIFLDQLEVLSRYPKEKKILFLWEPPSVLSENYNRENHRDFSKVYTWHDGLVDNKKYFKFFYPVIHPMIENPMDFHLKNLCTLIACNKESSYPGELYSERHNLIQFFEYGPYDGFTLYGKWWPSHYRTYGGPIDKKLDILKSFRFCFAYENIRNIPGYITEKIFDCFQAGTVPIYWGAPNISDYIPKSCFISREDFPSNEALYNYIKNMDEARHREYVENIRKFLASKEAQLYSQDHFISIFMKMISTPSTHQP